MNISITDEETKVLIEMLTISGYMMTQVDDQAISKAEQMHNLIQKIYTEAQKSEAFKDSFEHDPEAQMIFPNASIMAEGEDSPLYMLRSYNEFAATEVLSQHLGIVDASKEMKMDDDILQKELNPEFMELFAKKRDEYLQEFAENGFNNLQVSKIILS